MSSSQQEIANHKLSRLFELNAVIQQMNLNGEKRGRYVHRIERVDSPEILEWEYTDNGLAHLFEDNKMELRKHLKELTDVALWLERYMNDTIEYNEW